MNCFNYFRYGDVIRTKRELGYYHYGIYEKDHKVYEYSNNKCVIGFSIFCISIALSDLGECLTDMSFIEALSDLPINLDVYNARYKIA